jgi:hypothetical protein
MRELHVLVWAALHTSQLQVQVRNAEECVQQSFQLCWICGCCARDGLGMEARWWVMETAQVVEQVAGAVAHCSWE